MARVTLEYGEEGRQLELPAGAVVVEPLAAPAVPDAGAALLAAIGEHAGRIFRPGEDVCVVVPDITRPAPTRRVVACLLELAAGVPGINLRFLIGTGAHRPCTPAEIETILGEGVPGINHDARDSGCLRRVGQTPRGLPVWLNRLYLDAARRITISLLEPHFFAGFSGGPKAVVPGIAGLETILGIHSAPLIGDPATTWARLDGNPVQEEIRAACALAPPDLSINVSINRDRAITGVFAGEVGEAHRRGCAFVRGLALRPVDHRFEVVLTTNGGWPLDQNLYQTVKGMSAAARIVEPGGVIVTAAECRYGFPPGNFEQLLRSARSPGELLRRIESFPTTREDQWEAQVLCLIVERATVFLYSRLDPAAVRKAFLHPVPSVEEGLRQASARCGAGARVAVLPQGPFTIPYVRTEVSPRDRL